MSFHRLHRFVDQCKYCVTLRICVTLLHFPLLPAASYLHLTVCNIGLHLVKTNAGRDSVFLPL